MNQHFPSRKTSRRSCPASSPPGQAQAARPLPWAQRRSRPSSRTIARGSVAGWATGTVGTPAPTAVPRSSAFRFPTRGLLSLLAGRQPLSAERCERCSGPGHGNRPPPTRLRDRRSTPLRGYSRGSAPCRAMSPRGTGLCPAATHSCSQVTSHATLGSIAHHGAPPHGAGSRLKVK